MTTASKITLVRVVLIPVFMVLLLCSGGNDALRWAALGVFVVASISDFVDGYIARHYNQVTDFGKFLDPLADKLLICSILIEMVGLGWVPAWIVIIIIIRELAVTGLRAVAADKGVVIAADWYGKWKTVFQIIAMVPLLIHFPVMGLPVHLIGTVVLYIALVLTIFSGCNYFYLFYRQWRDHLAENN